MVKEFGLGIEREVIPVTNIDGVYRTTDYFSPSPSVVNIMRQDGDYAIKVNNKIVGMWHRDPSVDGIELQSGSSKGINWKNKTVKKALAEIRYGEKAILKHSSQRVKAIMPFGTVGDRSNRDRHGSYHFTITMPHESEVNIQNIKKHNDNTKKMINNVQWLEPLLIAKTGGTSPDSIGDAGKYLEGSERTALGWGGALGSSLASFNGTSSTNDSRYNGNSRFWRDKVVPQSSLGVSSSKAEVRARKKNDGYLPFSAPYYVGAEFRFFDSFDSQFVPDYLKVMLLGGVNSSVGNEAHGNPALGDAMARVIEEGYNAYLPKSYVKAINEELKLGLTDSELKNVRASDFGDKVFKKLWEKNKEHSDVKSILGIGYVAPPQVFDISKASHDYFFRKKLLNDTGFREMNLLIVKGLLLIDTTVTSGEIGAGSSGKGIKTILEDIVGKNLSAEDTRDYIDFYEGRGLFSVVRNDDGSIDSIKLKYGSEDEGVRKFNDIVNDKSFYGGKAKEPLLDNYESDDELASVMFAPGTRVRSSSPEVSSESSPSIRRTPTRGIELQPEEERTMAYRMAYNRYMVKFAGLKNRVIDWENELQENVIRLNFRQRAILERIRNGIAQNFDGTTEDYMRRRYAYLSTLFSHLKQEVRTGQRSRSFKSGGDKYFKPVKVSSYDRSVK